MRFGTAHLRAQTFSFCTEHHEPPMLNVTPPSASTCLLLHIQCHPIDEQGIKVHNSFQKYHPLKYIRHARHHTRDTRQWDGQRPSLHPCMDVRLWSSVYGPFHGGLNRSCTTHLYAHNLQTQWNSRVHSYPSREYSLAH